MNDTYVTLQGWVGGEVKTRDAQGQTVTSFRVGCTPRYRGRDGEWHSAETQWYTVECWRRLGEHVGESVRSGDPVVVHGRVRLDVWQREDDQTSVTWVIDASFVGHDLNRGTTSFTKRAAGAGDDVLNDEAVRQMRHNMGVGGPQLTPDGAVVEPAPDLRPAV